MICTQGEGFSLTEVNTWQESCGLRTCTNCPKHKTLVPEERKGERVKVAQWCSKYCTIKGRKIHNLWDEEMSLTELAAMYDKQLDALPKHIYMAARQWKACKWLGENLAPGQIFTIEDFQMSLEVG